MTTLDATISSPPTVKGFDVNQPISAAQASIFYAAGYRFCLRYVSLSGSTHTNDLSVREASDILEAGLALMPVQHCPAGEKIEDENGEEKDVGWVANEENGRTRGQNAAKHVKDLGIVGPINVWCDLENVSAKSSASDIIAYCNAWYDAVNAAGYAPGLYVGPCAHLTADQLYGLKMQHYWKSGCDVPIVSKRGYQMFQSGHDKETIHGVDVDVDYAGIDLKGGRVAWLVRGNPGA